MHLKNPYQYAPSKAFKKLLLCEFKLARRVPYGLILGLGLPMMLLIIFGSIPALRQVQSSLDNQSYFDLSVPTLIGLAITGIAFISLPNALVTYREQGVLRRLSTTPVPPSWLLAAQIIVNMVVAIIGLSLLVIVGMIAFNLNSPRDWFGYVVTIILTITSLFTLGIWIAAIARNNMGARAMGGILFYIVLFFGGLWIPRPIMPKTLLDISNWTPLGSSVAGIQNTMQGHNPTGQALLCLGLYTVVFALLSVKSFRWD